VTQAPTPEDPLAPVGEPAADESSPDPFGHGAGDAARYRQVLGHFATGVTVVTTASGGVPAGLAVNSFTSVSLDPPLVAFCVAHTSSTWPRIRAAGAFCVNILAEDQEDVCRVFASKEPDKFRGIGWKPAVNGAPLLADVLGWIECDVDAIHEAGDHDLVIGAVRDLAVVREDGPLVFFRGGYGRYEP
jgi:flavin reductase (DIM6/NTAB) family NADH-FMN oxidoreductase RutF